MKKFSLTPSQKIVEGVCAAVLLGMVLGPILFWGRLPDQIPGHYNGAGSARRRFWMEPSPPCWGSL